MALDAWCNFDGFKRRRGIERNSDDTLTERTGSDFNNFSFIVPSYGLHPKAFVERHFSAGPSGGGASLQFLKGTTTLGFCYEGKGADDKGGVVVAVDSRASAGGFIASSTVMKILDISDLMVGTMAGGAADCQFWMKILARRASLFELENNEPMSVAAASKYISNSLYQYSGMGISVGTMIAGIDKRGPSLYYVDSEGKRLGERVFAVGSGMLSALSVLDSAYKPRMTDAEARDLGVRAIMHATYRDIGSGGVCNVCHITSAGKQYYEKQDVSRLYEEHMKNMNREPYDPVI